ncbi:unnamed protein product [Ilex paraguariensis]|uniref:Uncharacterized protein n=1 Tax=Ilex paraguariensis TaxID=185542 RepID=A0ABC8UCZ0_9AQUA
MSSCYLCVGTIFVSRKMANMKVEIISRETIKPSSPTPPQQRTFEVSLLDQLSPSIYVPIIFYYPISEGHHNVNQISDRLKDSLSKTLSRFYPLAGRIKDHASIDCNDEGALFSEAQVNCHLSEVLKDPKTDLLDQFLPCSIFPMVPLNDVVQVAVQLNIFASGGIAIGLCFFHEIVDGATMSAFVKCWAAITRGSYDEAAYPDCFVASKLFPPIESMTGNVSLLNESWVIKPGKGVRRRFVFDAAAISALKAEATSQLVPTPSRFEVVSSFIWKSALAASRSALGSQHQQPSILSFSVDMRRRMEPPLSEKCTGNLAWQALAHRAAPQGDETDLQGSVSRFREAVAKINNDFVQTLQNGERFQVICKFKEEQEEMYPDTKPEMYVFTSWCKFGFNEVDFGWGKPIWVSNIGGDTNPIYVNTVTLMDTSCSDGIEAWMLLNEKVMAILENNPEFCAVASLNPSISNQSALSERITLPSLA